MRKEFTVLTEIIQQKNEVEFQRRQQNKTSESQKIMSFIKLACQGIEGKAREISI